MWKIASYLELEKCLILIISSQFLIGKKFSSNFYREPTNENKQLQKYGYLIHIWSDKALKGAFVNLAICYLRQLYRRNNPGLSASTLKSLYRFTFSK